MKKFLLIVTVLTCEICAAQSLIGMMQPANDPLQRKATKAWKAGDYTEAEKLYYQAFANKPSNVSPLYELAKNKYVLGDYVSGNRLMDHILNVYQPRNDHEERILRSYWIYKINENFKAGDAKVALENSVEFTKLLGDKVDLLEQTDFANLYQNASEVALAIEDKVSLEKLYQSASNMKKADYESLLSFVYLCIVRKEFDLALQKVNDVIENGGGYFQSKAKAKVLLPVIYTYMGENDKALESIENVDSIFDGGYFNYLYGIIALNKGDYHQAISRFTAAMRGISSLGRTYKPIAVYRFYAKRAEAHLGLGDLISAKKDFEAALTFNSSYMPAINGLAELEGTIVSERVSDKTPPTINITEPATARGSVVVSSGDEVMIKGFASDKGGLKEVTLNGQKIYSKLEGDFWGSVPLQDGLNKVTIVATDVAGNSIEQIFEIEKNSSSASTAAPVKEGKNYTLLIASQNYTDTSIQSLEKPIPDAVKLKLILKNSYNFHDENIMTLFNPRRSDLKQKFLELREVLQPEDNLVIFYAGHGIWVDKDKKGYWLMTDAIRNDVNTWLPNKEVLNMIADLPARNTLLITDACFSGSVFKTRSIGPDAPQNIKDLSNKISRVAITSGNDTEVPDESVFMKYLVKALSENKEKYLTAQKMFINNIIEAVMTESKTEPRYGTLELAGHVGGDYIFSRK